MVELSLPRTKRLFADHRCLENVNTFSMLVDKKAHIKIPGASFTSIRFLTGRKSFSVIWFNLTSQLRFCFQTTPSRSPHASQWTGSFFTVDSILLHHILHRKVCKWSLCLGAPDSSMSPFRVPDIFRSLGPASNHWSHELHQKTRRWGRSNTFFTVPRQSNSAIGLLLSQTEEPPFRVPFLDHFLSSLLTQPASRLSLGKRPYDAHF